MPKTVEAHADVAEARRANAQVGLIIATAEAAQALVLRFGKRKGLGKRIGPLSEIRRDSHDAGPAARGAAFGKVAAQVSRRLVMNYVVTLMFHEAGWLDELVAKRNADHLSTSRRQAIPPVPPKAAHRIRQ